MHPVDESLFISARNFVEPCTYIVIGACPETVTVHLVGRLLAMKSVRVVTALVPGDGVGEGLGAAPGWLAGVVAG